MKRILLVILLFWAAMPLYATTGSVVGSLTFGPAKFSNGLIATSDSNYIALPAGDLNITSTSSWTIEAWLKIPSSGLSSGPVAIMLGDTVSGFVWVGVHSNGDLWAGVAGTAGAFAGTPSLDSGKVIDDNNWHHCVVEVAGGTTLTFYVDGVAGASFTGQFSAVTTAGAIGRFTLSTGASWPGSIDEVAFWSVNKYASNFTPPTSPYLGTEANLAALYHLQADGTDSGPNPGAIAPPVGMNGTLVGIPTFGPAEFSNGLVATSDSNYISLPAGDLSITPTSSWTIEAWLKIPSTGLSSGPVEIMLGDTVSGFVWVGVHSNGDLWAGVAGTAGAFAGTPSLDSGRSIDDNNWHHCVVEVSGGTTLTFYVDGVVGASLTGQFSAVTTAGAVGRFTLSPGASWPGSIDEVAFWSVNRYASNFTPPTSPYLGSEANLVALYHLQADGTDSGPNGSTSLTVTTTSLPSAGTGAVYSQTLTATGGVSPYSWSIQSGSLPAGLSLGSATGVVSGTPTGVGTSRFVVGVADSASHTATASLSIAVSGLYSDIAPTSTSIVYSPYNWVVTGSSATTINSGAYFRTIFSGTSVALLTNTANNVSPFSELWARVDGDVWQELVLSPGNPTLTIATGLQSRKHFLEVVVKSTSEFVSRWASNSASMVTITGLQLDSGAATEAPAKRNKNILYYGASQDEGYRTVNATAPLDTDQSDVLVSFAYALANATNSEVGLVAFGGTGVTVAGQGGVPALTSSYNYVYSGAPRSFSPAPDVVVYDEGFNDTGSITSGFESVINGINSVAPNAKQLLLIPFNQTHIGEIQAAVSAINSPNVTWQGTSPGWYSVADTSDGQHPYGYWDLGYIAPQLSPIVQQLLY